MALLGKGFQAGRCSAFVREGTFYIMTPGGEVIPAVIDVTIQDNLHDFNKITLTMMINLVESESEALAKYLAAKRELLVLQNSKDGDKDKV